MSLDISLVKVQETEVFEANITQNLGGMAHEAKLYQCLWRPEELGIEYAKELITPLSLGLMVLKNDPEKFKKFNPDNGWGTYDILIAVIERYLKACKEDPDAKVYTSR